MQLLWSSMEIEEGENALRFGVEAAAVRRRCRCLPGGAPPAARSHARTEPCHTNLQHRLMPRHRAQKHAWWIEGGMWLGATLALAAPIAGAVVIVAARRRAQRVPPQL